MWTVDGGQIRNVVRRYSRLGKGIYKMAEKKPSKADLSKAGKDLQNPRTSEKRETEAAKTLQKGAKKK
jgi:hypothetical protein